MKSFPIKNVLPIFLGLLVGCSYTPYLAFDNQTKSALQLEIIFQPTEFEKTCPSPEASFLPSSHLRRRFRKRDTREVRVSMSRLIEKSCRLMIRIPPKTALEFSIGEYLNWGKSRNESLFRILEVSMEGEAGSLKVATPEVEKYVKSHHIGLSIWKYPR